MDTKNTKDGKIIDTTKEHSLTTEIHLNKNHLAIYTLDYKELSLYKSVDS